MSTTTKRTRRTSAQVDADFGLHAAHVAFTRIRLAREAAIVHVHPSEQEVDAARDAFMDAMTRKAEAYGVLPPTPAVAR